VVTESYQMLVNDHHKKSRYWLHYVAFFYIYFKICHSHDYNIAKASRWNANHKCQSVTSRWHCIFEEAGSILLQSLNI